MTDKISTLLNGNVLVWHSCQVRGLLAHDERFENLREGWYWCKSNGIGGIADVECPSGPFDTQAKAVADALSCCE